VSDEPKPAKGWTLTPAQRIMVVQGRQMVQPPGPDDAKAIAANMRAMSATGRGTGGVPPDVLMTLEALRQLAEQGNLAAKWLYEEERAKFGISTPAVEA
jgi:hypothetical protein